MQAAPSPERAKRKQHTMAVHQERKADVVTKFKHPREGHRLPRGPGRAAHRAHHLPHRALQDAQEGPPLPPRPAEARRSAPPPARLPEEQGREPLQEAHRRPRHPQVGARAVPARGALALPAPRGDSQRRPAGGQLANGEGTRLLLVSDRRRRARAAAARDEGSRHLRLRVRGESTRTEAASARRGTTGRGNTCT